MSTTGNTKTSNLPPKNDAHSWHPRQDGDSRSPCPALNTLANHGYIPRDGKNLSEDILIHALQEAYNCSLPLAYFLTYGGLFLLRKSCPVSLHDFALHNHVEHNASLAHKDAELGHLHAPTVVDNEMLEKLLKSSASGQYFTAEDVGAARVRRQNTYDKENAIGSVKQEVARGEFSLILGIFGHQYVGEDKVPLNWLRVFFAEERLPEGWRPMHTMGLIELIQTSAKIRQVMNSLSKVDEKKD